MALVKLYNLHDVTKRQTRQIKYRLVRPIKLLHTIYVHTLDLSFYIVIIRSCQLLKTVQLQVNITQGQKVNDFAKPNVHLFNKLN